MKKSICYSILLMLVLMVALFPVQAAAKNPIVRYFSRLLDESRAEMAIGELMLNRFFKELAGNVKIELEPELTARVRKLAESTSRPDFQYSVYLMKSEIPDELIFPGGAILITTGLLDSAVDDLQKDFILSRNLMQQVLRQPMKLLKKEGLYAGFLNQIKLAEDRRDDKRIRSMIRDYLRNLVKMDHKKADLQGILLSESPEKTRKAAIELLKNFTGRIWPVLPMDTGDLPGRIEELEKLKLPE